MAVQLKFNSMEDFEPANVVRQVEPLRRLLETRNKLRDLLTKVDLSPDLENVLEDILENTDKLKQLSSELGLKAAPAGEEASGQSPPEGPNEEGNS
jgi:type VI secretion system protein ImpB